MTKTKPGLFIVFEGVEGCGKSSLTRHVANRYGFTALKTPLNTHLALREEFERNCHDIYARAEFYAAANLEVNDVVEAALAGGNNIVLDRNHLSTLTMPGLPCPGNTYKH